MVIEGKNIGSKVKNFDVEDYFVVVIRKVNFICIGIIGRRYIFWYISIGVKYIILGCLC